MDLRRSSPARPDRIDNGHRSQQDSVNGTTVALSASPWIVLLVILAAFAFAYVTYRRTLPPVRPARRWTLTLLRTIGIGLLLVALFEPILSRLRVTVEEPEVVVAIDNSQSMRLKGTDSSRIAEARELARRLESSPLAERSIFTLFTDTALAVTPPLPYGRIDAGGAATRIDAPFALAADSLRRKNIRAIVVMSDGRYNAGSNPLFEAEKLGVPVYAVGLGDSVEPRDLSVQEIFTNEIAYVGAQLPVEVRAKSAGFDGGTATITLHDDAGVIASQTIRLAPGTNDYTASFTYTPRREGIAKLRAQISTAPGELTERNNARSAFVKVKSNRRRYVLVAGAPSPDVAFIRRQLEQAAEIQVKTFVQKGGGSEFIEGKLDEGAFREAEAVILVGFPTAASSDAAIATIRTAAERGNIPLLFVAGDHVDPAKLRPLEPLLPVTFGATRGTEMLIFGDPTPSGGTSPIMHGIDPASWNSLPPIYRTETSTQARPESEVLATVRLGNTHLDEPLIVARRLGRSRSMAILGYGIYRWQLLGEGLRASRGESGSGLLGSLLSNSLRWLATREEQKQVRIVTSKQLYDLGEPVRFLGQVYDESYNPIPEADVTVTVEGGGRRYPLSLAPAGNGRYEGTLNGLPAGDYSFNGRATASGREVGTDMGRFSVGEVGLEYLQPSMNAELMRSLATRTGGRFYTWRTAGSLLEDIRNNRGFSPRSIEGRDDVPLWSYPWLLAIALGAFALEWIIRKRSGMV